MKRKEEVKSAKIPQDTPSTETCLKMLSVRDFPDSMHCAFLPYEDVKENLGKNEVKEFASKLRKKNMNFRKAYRTQAGSESIPITKISTHT